MKRQLSISALMMSRFSAIISTSLLAFAAFLVGLLQPSSVLAYDVPEYQGLVNDYAEMLSPVTEKALENQLSELALSEDGAEFAIVTIPSLEDEPIEMVAQDFFDTWEIGKSNKDNGLLLLIADQDREVRIQTGYGTEVVITDSVAGQVIRTDITPAFKQEQYDQGVIAATQTLVQYLQDPDQIPTQSDASESSLNPAGILFLFYVALTLGISGLSYLAAFFGRSKSWWLGGVIGFVLGMLAGKVPGGIAFGLLGLILDYILSKNYKKWKIEHRTTKWRETMGGFRPSGSSKSSSGFSSFGGGSSGGGGASGKW